MSLDSTRKDNTGEGNLKLICLQKDKIIKRVSFERKLKEPETES